VTLREAIYYTAVCDLCSKDHGADSDYSAWGDASQADMEADASEWHVERGNHICYNCVPRSLDLLDEDEIDPGHGVAGHFCYDKVWTAEEIAEMHRQGHVT
jgi:hypothetical protein